MVSNSVYIYGYFLMETSTLRTNNISLRNSICISKFNAWFWYLFVQKKICTWRWYFFSSKNRLTAVNATWAKKGVHQWKKYKYSKLQVRLDSERLIWSIAYGDCKILCNQRQIWLKCQKTIGCYYLIFWLVKYMSFIILQILLRASFPVLHPGWQILLNLCLHMLDQVFLNS